MFLGVDQLCLSFGVEILKHGFDIMLGGFEQFIL